MRSSDNLVNAFLVHRWKGVRDIIQEQTEDVKKKKEKNVDSRRQEVGSVF